MRRDERWRGTRWTRDGRSGSSAWAVVAAAGAVLAALALPASARGQAGDDRDASAGDDPASAAASPASGAESGPAAVDVVQLANEGYLLRAGDGAVLIDAFVAEPYSIYGALPPDVHADLLAGRPPFDDIDLALVSHVHRDHFQPESAARFLERHPDTLLATSPQVLEALAPELSRADPDRRAVPRVTIRAMLPEPGEVVTFDHAGAHVELLRLSHGSGRFAAIQNLGHLVTLGGVTVAHLGDAEIDEDVFAPYALAGRGIDVALVPYWYLASESGRALVARHFPAAGIVATHVPPEELDEVERSLARNLPDAVLMREPLQSRRFAAAAQGAGDGDP